jgi:hypothetical protein
MNKILLLIKILTAIGLILPSTVIGQTIPPLTKESFAPDMRPLKIPPTARTIAPFRRIVKGMSMKQVIEIAGLPDRDIGSGIYIYIYNLADGSQIQIGCGHPREILYINLPTDGN